MEGWVIKGGRAQVRGGQVRGIRQTVRLSSFFSSVGRWITVASITVLRAVRNVYSTWLRHLSAALKEMKLPSYVSDVMQFGTN